MSVVTHYQLKIFKNMAQQVTQIIFMILLHLPSVSSKCIGPKNNSDSRFFWRQNWTHHLSVQKR